MYEIYKGWCNNHKAIVVGYHPFSFPFLASNVKNSIIYINKFKENHVQWSDMLWFVWGWEILKIMELNFFIFVFPFSIIFCNFI